MATTYQIPIRAQSLNQFFAITLPNGITYNFILNWNPYESTWNLDINDGFGNPLIYGTPLVAGTNLMGQYRYLGISSLYIQNRNFPDQNPAFNDLGTNTQFFTVGMT